MKRMQLKVIGLVQGVFYRMRSQEKAEELGLSGFVQNEADGSVTIEIQGEDEQVREFIHWCHQGSNGAKVESIHQMEIPISDDRGFSIK